MASKAYLNVFGRELWRRASLRDIGHVHKASTNPIRLLLLSFVEVLDLKDHGDRDSAIWCYSIGKNCERLRVIIVADRGRICNSRGSCRAIPIKKPLKLVFRNAESPLLEAPDDIATKNELLAWDRHGTSIDRLQHIEEAVIEFGCDAGLYRGRFPQFNWIYADRPVTSLLPLKRLSLVFTPLTPNSLYRDHAFGQTDHANLWVDTSQPSASLIRETTSARYDLCSSLALACVSAPKDCMITIANIDQIPIWTGQQAIDKVVGMRFVSGGLYSVYGLFRNLDTGTRIVEAQLVSDRLEAEEEIQGRVDFIKDMMKKWMQELLRAGGKDNELEARWAKITFVTLKEYMDQPSREDEWFNHPWQDDWL